MRKNNDTIKFKDATLSDSLDSKKFYCNRVDLSETIKGDGWKVFSFKVNFGVANWGIAEISAANEILDEAIFYGQICGNNLTISYLNARVSPYVIDLYSIDVFLLGSEIARVGQSIEIHVDSRGREVRIVVLTPEGIGSFPYYLSASDLLPIKGAAVCGENSNSFSSGPVNCQRISGHNGQHQYIDEKGHGDFDKSGSVYRPSRMFGLPTYCAGCGYMMAGDGNPAHEVLCFHCNFWEDMLVKSQDANSFVINGRSYRPGKGGFGGSRFNIVRNDGSTWSGELFTQGEIPDYLRFKFPDNAKFV